MKYRIFRVNCKGKKDYLYASGFTASKIEAEIFEALEYAILGIPKGTRHFKKIVIEPMK